MADNEHTLDDESGFGELDWIEIHNPSATAMDVSGWYLSDDSGNPTNWAFPAGTSIPAGGYQIVFASDEIGIPGELHADFKLSKLGEEVVLADPSGTIRQSISFAQQSEDVSFGLDGAGLQTLGFQLKPTPGGANLASSAAPVIPIASPDFDVAGSISSNSSTVSISVPAPDSASPIYFTTDGSHPSPDNPAATQYVAPISVTSSSTIRAAAYPGVGVTGRSPSRVTTHTFVISGDIPTQQRPTSPVNYPEDTDDLSGDNVKLRYDMEQGFVNAPGNFSRVEGSIDALHAVAISGDIEDIFGMPGGIYSNAKSDSDTWRYKWDLTADRAVSFEFFDASGNRLTQTEANARITGASSRNTATSLKHNFRFKFGHKHGGDPDLDYDIFGDAGVQKFDELILRNPTHDSWANRDRSKLQFNATYVNDAWAAETLADMGHLSPRHRFVNVYINGLYWGVYEVVERIDGNFLASHFNDGSDGDDFDVIGEGERVKDGTWDAWGELYLAAYEVRWLESQEIDSSSAYAEVAEKLDIDQFIDYVLVNLYMANEDWPDRNYRAGRKRVPEGSAPPELDKGKFRFYSWDAEWAFLRDPKPIQEIVDRFAEINFGPGAIFHNLAANPDFRIALENAIDDQTGSGQLSPGVADVRYSDLRAAVSGALPAEFARWAEGVSLESESENAVAAAVASMLSGRITELVDALDDYVQTGTPGGGGGEPPTVPKPPPGGPGNTGIPGDPPTGDELKYYQQIRVTVTPGTGGDPMRLTVSPPGYDDVSELPMNGGNVWLRRDTNYLFSLGPADTSGEGSGDIPYTISFTRLSQAAPGTDPVPVAGWDWWLPPVADANAIGPPANALRLMTLEESGGVSARTSTTAGRSMCGLMSGSTRSRSGSASTMGI